MTDANEPSTERPIAAVERVIAVFNVLAGAPGDLGTNEIARRAGINASTVSRMLATLAKEGFVHRVAASGRYRLGVRLVQLGNAALAGMDLRELARPHLIGLMEATGETVTLSVPSGDIAVTVDFVQSPSTVRSVAEIGRPSVTHATATGKLLLANDYPAPVGPLPAYTPRTITDHARLSREIAQVRAKGWAQASGERDAELNGVAVSILDRHNRLVAILGVQGPAGRFDEEAMAFAVDRLRERAAVLSSTAT